MISLQPAFLHFSDLPSRTQASCLPALQFPASKHFSFRPAYIYVSCLRAL
jgi:hypothetical protein